MTARGYRAAKKRLPSVRGVRDSELIPVIIGIHQDNYGVYGVRKMWHAMKRAGYDIGRDQVARLMKITGVCGVVRGRKPITTKPAKSPDTRPDLVQRNFKASAPNRLWVADITYIRTRAGFVSQPLSPMSTAGKLLAGRPQAASPLRLCPWRP